jgi:DNA-directed RNA polymerase specialized sigma24 family protein
VTDVDLDDLTTLAVAARDGDRAALEELCRRLQGPMYRLALRFTGQPAMRRTPRRRSWYGW